MSERLIHVHVDVEAIQPDGSIVVRHQVANEAVLTEAPCQREV